MSKNVRWFALGTLAGVFLMTALFYTLPPGGKLFAWIAGRSLMLSPCQANAGEKVSVCFGASLDLGELERMLPRETSLERARSLARGPFRQAINRAPAAMDCEPANVEAKEALSSCAAMIAAMRAAMPEIESAASVDELRAIVTRVLSEYRVID